MPTKKEKNYRNISIVWLWQNIVRYLMHSIIDRSSISCICIFACGIHEYLIHCVSIHIQCARCWFISIHFTLYPLCFHVFLVFFLLLSNMWLSERTTECIPMLITKCVATTGVRRYYFVAAIVLVARMYLFVDDETVFATLCHRA